MPAFSYRLQPLLDQKLEREQEAERAQVERRRDLRESEARLAGLQSRQVELEAARTACRNGLLSGESTGDEIRRRRDDLSLAARRVEDIKDEVMAQRIEIEERMELLENASAALAAATREVEVLNKHRSRSERRWLAEFERKEAIEQDEIAAAIFQTRRRP
jgi:flagellar biosynthesis chaperone FliJ